MPLHTTRTVCVDCGDFTLTDATGFYDETDNPGGYGTPNPDFGDTVPYTATFYAPNSSEPAYVLDLNNPIATPDEHGHYSYVVTRSMLGVMDPDIPSGLWRIQVVFGTLTEELVVFAEDDIRSKITSCVCLGGASNASMVLDLIGAKELCKCFRYNEAQSLIDQLYKQSRTCAGGCGCGCN